MKSENYAAGPYLSDRFELNNEDWLIVNDYSYAPNMPTKEEKEGHHPPTLNLL